MSALKAILGAGGVEAAVFAQKGGEAQLPEADEDNKGFGAHGRAPLSLVLGGGVKVLEELDGQLFSRG